MKVLLLVVSELDSWRFVIPGLLPILCVALLLRTGGPAVRELEASVGRPNRFRRLVDGAVVRGPWNRYLRQKAFRIHFPVFLDEVARRLRGGLSLSDAMLGADESMHAWFRGDFSPVRIMIESGVDCAKAVKKWEVAGNQSAVDLFAGSLAVGVAVGGVTPRTLDSVAQTIRDRLALVAEVSVQASQAKLSAIVMTLAPMLFSGLLVFTDERAANFLLATPVGLLCLAVGVGLDLVAGVWMARLGRVPG